MRRRDLRAVFAVMVVAALSLSSPTGQSLVGESPTVFWTASTEGTLLTWTPFGGATATYNLYRGPDAHNLTFLATTSTPAFLDESGRIGDVYGITSIVDGVESQPFVFSTDTQRSCVTVGTNGHVNVRPYNCMAVIG